MSTSMSAQVVGGRAADAEREAGHRPPALQRERDAPAAGQDSRRSTEPRAVRSRLGGPANRIVAAALAGAGAEVDDVVGGADDGRVVLDDDDGVALVAQAVEERGSAAPVSRGWRPIDGSSST